MNLKVKLVKPTWQNSGAIALGETEELQVGKIYTIKQYENRYKKRATLIEGHNNHLTGWWYDMNDFVIVATINNNIKII